MTADTGTPARTAGGHPASSEGTDHVRRLRHHHLRGPRWCRTDRALTALRRSALERSIASSAQAPGVPRTTGKGHVKSYGETRLCAVPGCSTRLSRYNSTPLCWVHEQAERLSRH